MIIIGGILKIFYYKVIHFSSIERKTGLFYFAVLYYPQSVTEGIARRRSSKSGYLKMSVASAQGRSSSPSW